MPWLLAKALPYLGQGAVSQHLFRDMPHVCWVDCIVTLSSMPAANLHSVRPSLSAARLLQQPWLQTASVLRHDHVDPLPVLSLQGAIPLLTALIQDGPHGPHAEGATWALHSLTSDHAINKQLAAEVSLPPDRGCQQFWHDETQAGCWG